MKFAFVAKHRLIWQEAWLCKALDVSRSGFHAWLNRGPSKRSRYDEELTVKLRASFLGSDRTYGARRVWHDVLAEGLSCGLHRIERLMRKNAMKARPRGRRLPVDNGELIICTIAPMSWTGSSMPRFRTGSGLPTSLTSGQPKAGSMWRRSLICSHGALSAGR